MNTDRSELNTPMRLAVVGVVVVALFAALLARLWYLQVLASEDFQVAAEANAVRTVYTPAPRGQILDRNGAVLVENRVVQVLTVDRAALKEDEGLVSRIATALNRPVSEIQAAVDDPRSNLLRPVPVARDLPKETIVAMLERSEEFPGLAAEQITERIYPYGALGAHVLGYVGEINDTELAEREAQGYRLGETIGKAGVELAHEDILRGTPGFVRVEVDRRNRPLRIIEEVPPVPGSNLYLTIDVNLQSATEKALAEGLVAVRDVRESKTDGGDLLTGRAGAAVAISPRTGEVLAIASNPTYDPAIFVNGISRANFAALQVPEANAPLSNRATQGLYAPASTFKLFTTLAGLESGLITAGTVVQDPGSYTITPCEGRCVFRNAGSTPYGPVALSKALAVSSDVYIYSLAHSYWLNRSTVGDGIQNTARSLGLGSRTGIDLPPEAQGRVPDPDIRKQMHEENPQAFPESRWFAGDNLIMAIGQGEVVATPLQLANAYGAFGNGGTVYRPHLALRAVKYDGTLLVEFGPEVTSQAAMSVGSRNAVLSGLISAVNDPSGTAHSAFAPYNLPVRVAGKTGTAQVPGKQDTALFVGFAPAESPDIAVAVVMEESGFGGTIAAPVTRSIMQAYFQVPIAPLVPAGGTD